MSLGVGLGMPVRCRPRCRRSDSSLNPLDDTRARNMGGLFPLRQVSRTALHSGRVGQWRSASVAALSLLVGLREPLVSPLFMWPV